jgi:hypothetical protein
MFVNDRYAVAISGGEANMQLADHGKTGKPIFDLDPKTNSAIAIPAGVDQTIRRITSPIETWQNAALTREKPDARR